MLDSIIRFSLRNRLAVIIISLLVVLAGTYTALTMEVDVFPDLNAPTVVVMTEASGMAPEEVERMVTFPIETAMSGATDVRRVRSTSQTGFSCVWVEFDWGTDIYRDRQIVSEKLSEVASTLPATANRPALGPQSSILGEVMIIGLTSDSTSQQDLRTYADWTIRPRLMSIGGVAQVAVHGGDVREYQVQLHPERMRHHGISTAEAVEAVRGVSTNVSGGILYEYGNEYLIRGELATADCDAIGQTVVKSVGGVPVLLNQIADIHIGTKTPKTGCASNNGRPAVLLTVAKQPGASTLDLTRSLDEALDGLKTTLPKDIHIDSQIFRQSRFIDASISNIQKSLIEGSVFVIIVLFLFLLNVRTTVISLVTIPLSLLVSILVLSAMGLTVNTMSIGGMAIAIGSLVDDAIVDVENVYKRLRDSASYDGTLKWRLKTIFEASREVRLPILNSTFIVIAAFLPLFFLSGMEGRMLIPLGIAFIVSLFASTVVALTLTPVLCSYLLVPERLAARRETRLTGWLKAYYRRALEWALRHARIVVGGTAAALVLAAVLFAGLGSNFLPPFNEGSFTISISTLPGVSLEESDKIGSRAEALLRDIPEIMTVARKTGRAELDEHAFGVNVSEIEAPFRLGEGRTRAELQHEVRERLATLPGVAIEIGQPISHRIDAMLSGTRANIAIKIFGTDLNTMYELGGKVRETIADVPGVADLNVEQQVERPQLRITPRRHMLAKYGVTPQQFADYIRVLLDGETVSQIYEGNSAFDLTVKVADEDRDGVAQIRSLMIDAGGQKIPLEYVANIESTVGPNTISRENVQRRIVVSANVEGRDLQSTADDIRARIAETIDLPEGYRIEYGGQFENAANASRILLLLSFVSLLIIFLLLYRQFGSARQAFIVLVNLPLALIGGVIALSLTGGNLSIPAIIGFISLFGIATRNGILLIDRYNSGDVSVVEGSLDRLTPILMTALTSALALVPLALGGDLPGNEIQSPMAKVILGGLVTSTFLNMFIVPLIYKYSSSTHNPKAQDNE